MEWIITIDEQDKEKMYLILNGHYDISFDRLQENEDKEYNWFSHLAGKRWVDMVSLLDAFLAAYDEAGIQPSEKFYLNWSAAVLKKAGSITYEGIRLAYEKKFHPGEKVVFVRADEIYGIEEMIEALVSGKKLKRRSVT